MIRNIFRRRVKKKTFPQSYRFRLAAVKTCHPRDEVLHVAF